MARSVAPGIIHHPDQRERHGSDASWDRDWKLLTGWKRWIVNDTGHQAFTDIPLLGPFLGIKPVPGTGGQSWRRARS
ncbi:hypothetical protein [Sinosporangium album]|uniref:hypothetical protein n=1 Tax=Sinosporangium album TaxID=504805 RepID=UPI000B811649|nr:hypothetical protein [Sinosporangium album]